MQATKLKITELFFSLQGEGRHSGLPCSFVRLTGCPLRCGYCDTAYAFTGGNWKTFEEIFAFLDHQSTRLVQITGGEPLAQKGAWDLIDELCQRNFKVLLETSGALSIAGIHPDCHIVMDLKTPGSLEEEKNDWGNLHHLKPSDEIKFVLTSMEDWWWTKRQVEENNLDKKFQILISTLPSPHELLRMVADAVVESGLNLRFQTQLHKLIWKEEIGK